MSSFAPGTALGPYRILSLLGRGGMGTVYRGRDARLGRDVAIKVLAPGESVDPRLRERFAREARAAARVHHQNVATLLDTGEVQGTPYLVFELLEGGTLETRIPLPWREAARLGARIARGLAAIHATGLIHRDVKPSNVLLDAADEPKLTDFGLVRLASGSALTRTSESLGTPGYMAPEQLEGSREVGPPADAYALGATLHALVSGRPPFQGTSVAVAKQTLLDPPPRLGSLVPDVPPALEALVRELLAKNPRARPTADEVARRLESLDSPHVRRRSRGALVLALVLGAIAAAMLGVFFLHHPGVAPTASPSPEALPCAAPSFAPFDEDRLPAAWRGSSRTRASQLTRVIERARIALELPGTINALRALPDGKTLLVARSDGKIHVHELETGRETPDRPLEVDDGARDLTTELATDSRGGFVVAGTREGGLFAWDDRFRLVGKEHVDGTTAITAVSVNDAGLVVFAINGGGESSALWQWQVSQPGTQLVVQQKERIWNSFADASGSIYWSTQGGHVRMLAPGASDPVELGRVERGSAVLGAFDGRLVGLSADAIDLWEPATRKLLRHHSPIGGPTETRNASIALSEEGEIGLLATARFTGAPEASARAVALATGEVLWREPVPEASSFSCRIGGTATHVWLSSGGTLIRAGPVAVSALALMPDGERLVVGSRDGSVRLYSLATGEPGPFKTNALAVAGLDVSPAGDIVVARVRDSKRGALSRWNPDRPERPEEIVVSQEAPLRSLRRSGKRVVHGSLTELHCTLVDGEFLGAGGERLPVPEPESHPPLLPERDAVAFVAPDRYVAAFGSKLMAYQAREGTDTTARLLPDWKSESPITALIASPEPETLLVATADGAVRSCRARSGEDAGSIAASGARVTALAAAGRLVAIARKTGKVELVRSSSREPAIAIEAGLAGEPRALLLTRQKLVVGTERGTVLVFDLAGGF